MYKSVLFLSLLCSACNLYKGENKVLFANLQSNKVLSNFVNSNKIDGYVGGNFYKNTKSDSLVFLHVSRPNEQNYPIDSIYYFYHTDSNYKLLAQSEFEKGLLYLEVDKNGHHNKYYSFGGYVLNVNNVQVEDKRNSLQLTFETDIWASTMPDTVKQFIKIESNKDSIDFKIWNKFNKNDNWQALIPD